MSVQRTILSFVNSRSNSAVSIPSSNQSEETQLQSSVSSEVSHPRVYPPATHVCVTPTSVAKTSSSESSSQSSAAVLESSSKQDVERDVELTSRANLDFSSEEQMLL